MDNSDLAEKLATDHGLTKADARKAVNSVFAAITQATADGGEVSLSRFGTFRVKDSLARDAP